MIQFDEHIFSKPPLLATSPDLGPPKGSFEEGKSPASSGKHKLVKYYILARMANVVYTYTIHGSYGMGMVNL